MKELQYLLVMTAGALETFPLLSEFGAQMTNVLVTPVADRLGLIAAETIGETTATLNVDHKENREHVGAVHLNTVYRLQ